MTPSRRSVRVLAARAVVVSALVAALPATLAAQNNLLDLRFLEANNYSKVTYQNFIYARAFDDGRYIAQGLYLRVPQQQGYKEGAAALGVRVVSLGGADVYTLAGVATASDANYFEPAILVTKTKGLITGSAYVQRYVPLSSTKGIGQWLLDPIEAQVAVPQTPFAIGASMYAYRANESGGLDSPWLTKIGPKIGYNDRWGTTELRVTHVSQDGGQEFQLRRIFVF